MKKVEGNATRTASYGSKRKLLDAGILHIVVIGEVLQLRIQIQHPLFCTLSYHPSSHDVIDETSATENRWDRQVGTTRAFPR